MRLLDSLTIYMSLTSGSLEWPKALIGTPPMTMLQGFMITRIVCREMTQDRSAYNRRRLQTHIRG